MKYVCSTCAEIFYNYGAPCSSLIDIVTRYSFEEGFVAYDAVYSRAAYEYNSALEYLENKGFVVSTEVTKRLIAIIPNFKNCYVSHWEAEICWCKHLRKLGELDYD